MTLEPGGSGKGVNMMSDVYTASFEKWGHWELAEGANILNAYAEHGQPDFLSDGITLNFNPTSGKVFMSDSEYNVAVLEGDELVQFFYCAQCGFEGTEEEASFEEGKSFVKNEGYCSKACFEKNKE